MRYNDIIKLIKITYISDNVGNQIPEETGREVYANMFSISATEFYNAALAGLRPSFAFEIYSFEYDGETKLEYKGKTYNIIRVNLVGEKARLICEEVAGR